MQNLLAGRRPFTSVRNSQRNHQRCRRQHGLACSANKVTVVLTREEGKNDKMHSALTQHGIRCVELPLIEHAVGPDRDMLSDALKSGAYDWVAVTSPEAAAVFVEGWQAAQCPNVRIAVVGGGTGEILQQAGITPTFVASKATGKTMGGELPRVSGGQDTVLYPASMRASQDLQDSLSGSGFKVTRLNTYDTRGVSHVEAGLLQQAREAQIMTFGSPSAVKSWVSLVGLEVARDQISVCIGATSAKACKAAGLTKIYYPESPGVEGWVASVLDACEENKLGVLLVPQ